MWFRLALSIGLIAVCTTPAFADPTYTFTNLPGIGSFDAAAIGVNNAGTVSGWQFEPGQDHAGFWSLDGTFNDIGRVDGRRMFGRGINNGGEIVGFSFVTGVGSFPFKWTGGAPVELANGGAGSVALGINDAGAVSGSDVVGGVQRATLWLPDGTNVDIGAGAGSFGGFINNLGHMTGGTAAFAPFYYDGTLNFLDPLVGDIDGIARGINDHDVVVGNSGFPTTRAVYWDAAGVHELPDFGPNSSDAFDVNNQGLMVGTSEGRAVLWLPDETLIDLSPFLPAGTVFASANSISETGFIAGVYVDPVTGYVNGFRLSPIPEPSYLGMLVLIGALAARRRRRRAA